MAQIVITREINSPFIKPHKDLIYNKLKFGFEPRPDRNFLK